MWIIITRQDWDATPVIIIKVTLAGGGYFAHTAIYIQAYILNTDMFLKSYMGDLLVANSNTTQRFRLAGRHLSLPY